MTKHPQQQKPSLPVMMRGISIATPINQKQLLEELHDKLGVTAAVQSAGGKSVLAVKGRKAGVTDAQIASVIAAHKPVPAPTSVASRLQKWGSLSAADKDQLTLDAFKQLFGVR